MGGGCDWKSRRLESPQGRARHHHGRGASVEHADFVHLAPPAPPRSPGGLRGQPRPQCPSSQSPSIQSPSSWSPGCRTHPTPPQRSHLPSVLTQARLRRGAGEEAAAALNKGRAALTCGGRAAAVGTCPPTRRGGERHREGGREEGGRSSGKEMEQRSPGEGGGRRAAGRRCRGAEAGQRSSAMHALGARLRALVGGDFSLSLSVVSRDE